MTANSKRTVLHVAVEYPSQNRSTNTPAVRNFIRANPEVDYRVFALRRTSNPFKCNALVGDDQGDAKVTSMKYWGLPFGLLLFLSMTIVAWRIYRAVLRENLDVDLVHAHKFSFEGIAGWWLSKWLKIPLALSVRGEAEQKIMRFKPHYIPFFKRQLKHASRIYYVSAWFRPQLEKRFQFRAEQQQLLPNFVASRQWRLQDTYRPDRLVSIMDLNVLDKKGLPLLLQALAQLRKDYPSVKLDIIGGGFEQNITRTKALIAAQQLESTVTLLGKCDNNALLNALPTYAAMVLPSKNETFGMAYVEALLSGIPILHSSHTGIDGFLDGIEGRVSCPPDDLAALVAALRTLLEHQQPWRRWLNKNHQLVMERFERQHYINEYNRTFNLIVPTPSKSPPHQPTADDRIEAK